MALRIRTCRRAALLVWLLAALAPEVSAAQPLSDYTLTSWTRRDGLPPGGVWAICQDRNGYLWIGSTAGLFRFDGVRFVPWADLGHAALPTDGITAMTTSHDGSLWLGFTGAGVARILNGAVTVYREGEDVSLVRTLVEDRQGTLWAAGRAGLYRFVADRWERLGRNAGLPDGRSQVYEDKDGGLWVSTSTGMFRGPTPDGRFEQTSSVPDAMAAARRVLGGIASNTNVALDRVHEDHDGNLWISTLGHGLWRIRDAHGAAANEQLSVETGLSNDSIGTVYEDRDRNVWVGTLSGLHQLTPRKLKPITHLGHAVAVEATPDGSTWIGSDLGLIRSSGGRLRTYTNLSGFANWNVRSVTGDRRGRLWVALTDGLVRFAAEHFERLALAADTRFGNISAMAVDSRDQLWMCDFFRGVLRWHDGVLKSFNDVPGLNRQTPLTILADRDDRVWVGLSSGQLAMFEADDRFVVYDVAARAGTDGGIHAIAESDHTADARDTVLWLGVTNGIIRFTRDHPIAATTKNGFPRASVYAVTEDGFGAVWAATSIGLLRIEKDEFDRVAASPGVYKIKYKLYDDADGLDAPPISVSSRGVARAVDHKLWFLTDAGATVVEPTSLAARPARSQVRIEEVRAGNTRVESPTSTVTIPPGTSRLEVDYTALAFASPRSIRFEYRLDGFDTEWQQDVGAKRQAIYTNLRPGRYTFHVLARDKEGMTSTAEATLSIEPPFYQTIWFYLFSATAVIGLAIAAWGLRIRQVRARFALVLQERARISREVHDTLIQSLVAVAVQIGSVVKQIAPEAGGLREQLDQLRKQTEEQIREARESIWNLRSPTLERLGLVAALRQAGEQMSQRTSVRFSFAVTGRPQACPRGIDAHLLRIGREALTNVWRHARATEVRLELSYGVDRVLLRVSDNGIGFDPDAPDMESTQRYGLMTMAERAQRAGGELTIISGKDRGTEVVATFPLAASEAA
jgi:signal transduction histidine kinase/ligand-binding sensor domain-containing protein